MLTTSEFISLCKGVIFPKGSLLRELAKLSRGKRVRNRLSFAQTGEDILCSLFLPEEGLTYFDIGSGHPIHGSNTYLFYKQGNSGLLIDPLEISRRLSRLLRPRDHFIKAVVKGTQSTEVTSVLYETYPYEYSTSNLEDLKDAMVLGAELLREHKSEVLTAEMIEKLAYLYHPHLVSIDIEGSDIEVLQGLTFSKFKPRVICVEAKSSEERKVVSKLLSKHDYENVAFTALSSIFVSNSYLLSSGMMKHF